MDNLNFRNISGDNLGEDNRDSKIVARQWLLLAKKRFTLNSLGCATEVLARMVLVWENMGSKSTGFVP